MPYGLYLSADGAHVQDKRIQTLANNLANVDTVGFKRELAIFQARYAESISAGMQSPGLGGADDIGGGILLRETKTDFTPGPLKRTQIPTDMAIEGEGFFVVQKGEEKYLTRAGNFRLTNDGSLVTQQGYPVLNDAGSPIVIGTDGGSWSITPEGEIRQQNGQRQMIGIQKPANYSDLAKVGENLFRPLAEPQAAAPADRHVAGGYVELSAVRPTLEMTELIEASRILEANINMMKTQDQTLSGLVNRVLKV